ncbi:hypothetical protein GGF46_003731 [Coemansia sp. RSA 552]|nr:hypothetical protein GGF46_003731 [Coemansia sp. RSA 552]
MAAAVADPLSATKSVAAKHAVPAYLISDDVEAAFSPLSSSTITITSLGSSLGFGSSSPIAGAKPDAKSAPVTADHQPNYILTKGADRSDDDGSDAGHGLGIRGVVGLNARSYSSANISTAAESSPSSASDNGSLEMTRGGMRSVSADHTREYGLQALSGEATDDSGVKSPVVPQPQKGQSIPAAVLDPEAVKADLDVSQQPRPATAGKPHTSLTKRLFRPLTRKHGTGLGGAAEDTPPDSKDLIVPARAQSPAAGTGEAAAMDVHAEAKRSPDSAHGDHDRVGTPGCIAAADTAVPENSTPSVHAVPSKSLDISRTEAALSRGSLRRRMMQRSKQDAADPDDNNNSSSRSSTDSNGTAVAKDAAIGPARFQALSRSLASRLGFSSLLADRRRSDDLRFVIAPHPHLPDVVDVYDCDEATAVYRKVSRSGKSWHETFHEVGVEDELNGTAAAVARAYSFFPGADSGGGGGGGPSDYEMASALGLPYPGLGFANGSNSAAASCVTFQSSTSSAVADNRRALRDTTVAMNRARVVARSSMVNSPLAMSSPSTGSLANGATARMTRAHTSVGYVYGGATMSMYGGASTSVPFDKGLLWEALTPYPNQFPLHIKDSRMVIDTMSLASMVLDRHNFCYRFQLGHNRMRWMAKRVKRHQLALQCFVRSTLVAEVFVDYGKGYSPYNSSVPPRQSPQQSPSSNETSGISTPVEHADGSGTPGAIESPSSTKFLPEDGSLPVVTILPAAFMQLQKFETDVVESFIIFTGMQMLECLHI